MDIVHYLRYSFLYARRLRSWLASIIT